MLIKLAWRNLWRNKLRTSIMLSAMIFGLMGVACMMGFMTGMLNNMVHNAIAWQTSHIQIHHQAYIDNPDINATIANPDTLLKRLQNTPDIQYWSARVIADGMIASARSSRGIRINGVDPTAEAHITPLANNLVNGEWLTRKGKNPLLVSTKTAKRLRLKVGSKVVLTLSNSQGEVSGAAFRVNGIFKTPSTTFDDANVYVRDTDLAQLGAIHGFHEMAIWLGDNAELANQRAITLRDTLQSQLSAQNRVRDWRQIQPMLASIMASMDVNNLIMLSIFVLAMGFGIVNIMLMSVFERTREFGVLMAIGMQKHKIFILIMLETTLLGITGASLGLVANLGLMQLLQHTGLPLGTMAEGLGAYGVDTLLYPQVTAQDYQMIFITVVAASILAALYPARQILKQNPVNAMAEKH